MQPLISILIPAYNAQEWIAETIKSAIAQSWKNKEIIVVDDGSTDDTLAVARQFASKDVLVVTQQNMGASAARNQALKLSQGAYIQWLDADDLLSIDKITEQMRILERCEDDRTLCSAGWAHFAYRSDRAKFLPTALWCDLSPVEFLLRKFGQHLHMQTATWLVTRTVTETAGPWDPRLLSDDDGEYFCRVILGSKRIRFAPNAKVFWRTTPSGRLSYVGQSDRKMEALLLSMQLHMKYLRSLEESDRVRAACLAYLQYFAIDFYPERPDLYVELEKLATELGGKLEKPRFRWKYAWIEPLFGCSSAKRAQLVLPQLKLALRRSWDKTMHRLEKSSRGHNSRELNRNRQETKTL
jgi:glycosyltransferase involved in cell wall biosynthesis